MKRKLIKEIEVIVKIPYVCLTIEQYTNIIETLLEYSILIDYEYGMLGCLDNLMEIHMWNEEKNWIRKNKFM